MPELYCRTRSRSSTSACRCSPTRCARRAGPSNRWTGASRPAATRTLSPPSPGSTPTPAPGSTRRTPRSSGGWTRASRSSPGCPRSRPRSPASSGRMLLHCGPPLPYGAGVRPAAPLDARRRRSPRAGPPTSPRRSGCWRAATSGSTPANHHDTVVPMASAIGPSTPVLVVDDREGGTRAFAPLNQGPGEVAWFGRETDAAIARLRFLRRDRGPAVAEIVDRPARWTCSRSPRRASRWATTCTCAPRPRPTC